MATLWIELGFLLALIVANGIFSMSELAMVSARKSRLQELVNKGDRKARIALDLAEDPNRYLSTVQIGITLVGTIAAAFGGATIARSLDDWFETMPGLEPYSEVLGLAIVVVAITYCTLIVGELVPKRLALTRPEWIARHVAWPLRTLSWVAIPAVQLLSGSTNLVLRVLRVGPSQEPPVTEDEIKVLLHQGTLAGIFEETEHEILRRVLRLDDRPAGALLTRRSQIVWIDVADSPEIIQRKITDSPHSRFPVCEGRLDNVLGIVHVKDLLIQGFAGRPFDIRGLLLVPLFIFEGTSGLKVLEHFKRSGIHIAIVLDEYGSVEGLLTLNDILEAIVGDLPSPDEAPEPRAVARPDGSWLLDGRLSTEEFKDQVDPRGLPEGDYHTLAGFIITHLGHIPDVAERFDWNGLRFEIVDMDGNRVDKVLVTPHTGLPA